MGQTATVAWCGSRDEAESTKTGQQDEDSPFKVLRVPVNRVYNIDKTVLGEGSIAVVKKAWVRRRPQIVRAIKHVERKKVGNKATLSREIGILSAFDHPNICRLFEIYTDIEYFYLIMEFIDGHELDHELQENIRLQRQDETRCSVIMQQVFHAISYCHDRNVVHRDLKPNNIMICNAASSTICDLGPSVKVIDFGLALEGPGVVEGLSTGRLEGGMAYLAPEVHRNTIYSEASDMWSLGVIIFVMFLLRFPSNGDLHSEFLEIVSIGGRDIVSGLLKRDYRMRLVAAQAVKHPWARRETLAKNCSDSDRDVTVLTDANSDRSAWLTDSVDEEESESMSVDGAGKSIDDELDLMFQKCSDGGVDSTNL